MLLRTPAREAARIIVEDLLDTAGARSPPSSPSPQENVHWMDQRPDEVDDEGRLDEDDEISRQKVQEFLDDRGRGQEGNMVKLPEMHPRLHSPTHTVDGGRVNGDGRLW